MFWLENIQAVLKELTAKIMTKEVIAYANIAKKLTKLDPINKKSRCNYKRVDVNYSAADANMVK